jgi:uncharacterized membrane protein YfcA
MAIPTRPIAALLAASFLAFVVVAVAALASSRDVADDADDHHHRRGDYSTSSFFGPVDGDAAGGNSTGNPDDGAYDPGDDDGRSSSSSSSPSSHPHDHPPLFPPRASDAFGFLCASIGLVLAAGGGIGGGGILVPVYVLVLGFPPKLAIPLSNVTVLGGAIANTLVNARGRHPRHPAVDRPLIDWDLVLAMEPPTLAGALVGANLNKVLPEGVVAVLLAILLTATAHGTLRGARRMRAKEREEGRRSRFGSRTVGVFFDGVGAAAPSEHLLLNEPPPSRDGDDDAGEDRDYDYDDGAAAAEEVELLRSVDPAGPSSPFVAPVHLPPTLPVRQDAVGGGGEGEAEDGDGDGDGDGGREGPPEFSNPVSLEEILSEERGPRRRNVLLIVSMFLVVLLVNILKGGGGFASPLGIACGSALFWLAQCSLLAWIAFVSYVGRGFLLGDARRKAEAGYAYLDEDVRWDGKSTVVYPLMSALAGLFAGMFGIGGGIIKGPLMLAMGVHPAVASATSACMILFTSSTATATFCVYGLMVRDYAIAGAVLGFGATYAGQSAMARMLSKSRRNSYIAFSIGFVVLLSAILMAAESALRLASDGAADRSGVICDSHPLDAIGLS